MGYLWDDILRGTCVQVTPKVRDEVPDPDRLTLDDTLYVSSLDFNLL